MNQVKHYITFKVAPVRLPGALEWSANARPVTSQTLTKADSFEIRPSAKTQGTPKSLPFGIRMQFQPNTQNS
jgi:hypothetical protein